MKTIQAVGKKLKSKLQQAQGEVEQQTGQGFKGGMQKIKGKVNEFVADLQLQGGRTSDDADY